jgi:hypothetical protein
MSLMLNGPQFKFAAGVAGGLCALDAYREAYPKTGAEAARRSASKLMTNHDVIKEVARTRSAASGLAGSAVMDLIERRTILAQIARGAGKDSDRIAAIRADTDLGGDATENKLVITINRAW